MKSNARRMFSFCIALLPMLCVTQNPLHADELSELYLNSSSTSSSSAIGPNILIVLDTSGSMAADDLGFVVDPAKFWGAPYNKNTIYPGPCDANLVYRKSFSGNESDVTKDDFQSCTSAYYFPVTALACDRALDNGFAVDAIGEFRAVVPGRSSFNGSSLNGQWYPLSSNFNGVGDIDGIVIWRECATDSGTHGQDDSATDLYPTNSNTGYGWTNDPGLAKDISGTTRQLIATGNYINYYRWAQTRLAAVQTVLRDVVGELPTDTRLGVMRFDVKTGSEGSSDGGFMIKEFVRLGDGSNRADVIDRIFDIDPARLGGTPLGESLFEALQAYRGGAVTFGATAQRWNIDEALWPWDSNTTTYANVSSVTESRDPGDNTKYKSPIIYECQKSAVILLSDGDPDGDKNTWQYFKDLLNYANYAPIDCDTDSAPSSCLREVAAYMANEDMASTLTGNQTVTTHTVGFGADISAAGQTLLEDAATAGGGMFTMADSYQSLKDAFHVIFRQEIANNVSLSSPAVTVNAFNRLAHKDDLYFTMFDPAFDSLHWPGNIKKYKLKKQTSGPHAGKYLIVDANDVRALVEDSSEVAYHALSYWTDPTDPDVAANNGKDGNKTELGGAAGELTDGHLATRNVYTWLGNGTDGLTNVANHFVDTNSGITNAMLGISVYSTIPRDTLINWVRGVDTSQSDWQINPQSRKSIGATPHGVPAIVTYGTDETTATQVIYAPTNDGFLHAIDAATGAELWSFVPTEVMGSFADMYSPPSTTYINYALDASVIHHTEGEGATQEDWLFFGMRRGGSSMYALNVTDKNSPYVMWRIQGGVDSGFETLGQTWSDPRIATLKLGATDIEGTTVLVFGGGYDAANQDSAAASSQYVDDTVGNSVFIVKASDKTLLWRAGSDISANLQVTDMKSSIVASVDMKDKNEDGFTDLVYAVDLGGRIFRFDIDNHSNTASALSVTGGKIASLGAGDNGSTSNADNRKFFNTPDVVLVAKGGSNYWAINGGSGDRGRPKSNMTTTSPAMTGTDNYLFSVKDPHVFAAPSSYDYGITINELYDATNNVIQEGTAAQQVTALAALQASDGWKIMLPHNGEKALAEAKTFNFRVFFTTFDPTPLSTGNCNSLPGRARLYSLDLLTAGAVVDVDGDGAFTADDRSSDLTHGTIPPSVTLLFLENDDGMIEVTNIIGRSDDPADLGDPGTVRRTYWNIKGNDETEQ